MTKVGILYSRVRAEEKLLFAAFQRRGVDFDLLDDRKLIFELTGGQRYNDLYAGYDVIVERCINHSRALYSLRISAESPEEAVAFAYENMRDPELRKAGVGNPIRYWLLQDEPAALAWLAESDFDEKTKGKIVTIPDGLRANYERFVTKQKDIP